MNWINKELFPFKSNYIEIEGDKMHYVDEGSGDVILFVHGTPEWSFGYRDLIKPLSKKFRCIAPDHLGMGLSDKPVNANYSVRQHAARLEAFINKLELKNINIVANDFGGSIGLSYAIRHPGNVNRISIFNTWMWSLSNDKHYSGPGKLMNSWVGRMMYRQFNFPVRVIMPAAYGDKGKLTKEVHQHYKEPLNGPEVRNATFAFAKELMNSGEWWQHLWMKMDRIQDKPFLIFWGMKDKFIQPKELDKWLTKLPNAKVIRFENAGHFVQEEESERMSQELEEFFK